MTEKKTLEVCAGVTFRGGRLLLATRRPGSSQEGLWEFPGGKCQEGETLDACICRELQEELAIEVQPEGELLSLTYAYPEKIVRLHFMLCSLDEAQEAEPQEGQKSSWFSVEQLETLDFAPADKAFVEFLAHGGTAKGAVRVVTPGAVERLSQWFAKS